MYPVSISKVEEIKRHVIELPLTGEGDLYRAFVTSQEYTANLGGLSGADQKCNDRAHSENLCGDYRAWLSTSNADARNRVRDTAYYTVGGRGYEYKICDGIADLTDGTLDNTLAIDESGEPKPVSGPGPYEWLFTWTGTVPDGTKFGTSPVDFCNDWSGIVDNALVGYALSQSVEWTNDEVHICEREHALYCFEYRKDGDCDGYFREDNDCNDTNSTIYPGAPELCDGFDNNCDGAIPSNENDGDGDGYRICAGDCNDNDLYIHPGASERCNGVDDNCDGNIPASEADNDGDACRVCDGDCDDNDVTVSTTASEVCDNKDNDCDGVKDDNLIRNCGSETGICTIGSEKCVNGVWGNCDGVQPQQEICDGLDNDCDGRTDEGCTCTPGNAQSCGSSTGACKSGTQVCESGGVWGKCTGAQGPSTEICDGIDNDCDGSTDENLSRTCGANIGLCKQGVQYCENGSWGECKGGVEPEDEKCDNEDNDCDGTVDEGCECPANEQRSCGVDMGECGKGLQKCVEGIWSKCIGAQEPTDEVCDDLDNDCDGEVDEGYVCEEEEAQQEVSEGIQDQEGESKEEQGVGSELIIVALIVVLMVPLAIFVFYQYMKARRKGAVSKPRRKVKEPRIPESLRSPLG
ncbi:hypothetical protein JW766_05085 [Candidatus Dojkabacteria bacterium]|nr:hypothetical protein [Candidatus Dojkabacteria bacterium]